MRTTNTIRISHDRKHMTIKAPNGHTATLRSGRNHGFTDADLEAARTVVLNSTMVPQQVNRARLFHVGNRDVLLHINTGPPTWWYPRMQITRSSLMGGWLRALIALSWHDSQVRTDD